jgi:hypothetical protein
LSLACRKSSWPRWSITWRRTERWKVKSTPPDPGMTKTSSELAHLFCQLKAPAAARALPKLAERAREE